MAVHINDIYPAVAVPELMRILMDEEGLSWDDAWEVTTKNHFLYQSYDYAGGLGNMEY